MIHKIYSFLINNLFVCFFQTFSFCCKVGFILIFIASSLKTITGALTSKPFAYKVRPWEISTSYIIDVTNFFCEKIWVDLKDLEIVRILPWLEFSLEEKWISDKIRFCYDGFSLNWITKFFLKKKNLLIFLINFLLCSLDPLMEKYIIKDKKYLNWIKKFNYNNDYYEKINNYLFYYEYLNSYKKNLNKYYLFYKIKKKNSIYLSFFYRKSFINRYLILNLFKKKTWKFIKLLNNYFFARKYFLKISKKKIIIDLNKFLSLGSTKIYSILLNKNFNFQRNLNFFLSTTVDGFLLSNLKNYQIDTMYTKNFFNKTCQFFFPLNLSFFFKKKVFFLNPEELTVFDNFKIILLNSTNLWVANPKLHLKIWKLIKTKNLLVFSFATNNLLFKHINLGSKDTLLINILMGRHWVSNFFAKKNFCAVLISLDVNVWLYSFFFKKNEYNFFFKNYIHFKKKLFFLPSFFIYYFSIMLFSNYLSYFSNKNFKKFVWITSKMHLSNTNKIFTFLISPDLALKNELVLNFFFKKSHKIKKNFVYAFESNLNIKNYPKFYDFIFPTNAITENFFFYKNYFNKLVLSLSLRSGPRFSKNFLIFQKIFSTFAEFPFFWKLNFDNFFYNVNFLTIDFWIKLVIIDKLKESFKFSLIFKKSFKFSKNYINFFVFFKNSFFNSKNLWFSTLSFLKNSWYANFGANQLKIERCSFKKY